MDAHRKGCDGKQADHRCNRGNFHEISGRLLGLAGESLFGHKKSLP